jgi:hypothetical protein
MLRSGEQVLCRGSRAASSEANTRSGVRVPRARQRLAQGGVKPSSEAEIRLRGRQALERSGDLPLGGVCPSSEAEIAWCGAWPSSETEVRPRGAEAGFLMGR